MKMSTERSDITYSWHLTQVYLARVVCGGEKLSHRKGDAAFVKYWVQIANHFIQHNLLSMKSDILSSNY